MVKGPCRRKEGHAGGRMAVQAVDGRRARPRGPAGRAQPAVVVAGRARGGQHPVVLAVVRRRAQGGQRVGRLAAVVAGRARGIKSAAVV